MILVVLLPLALVVLDFGLIMHIVYVATVPDLLSPLVALPLGFLIASVVCVVFIAGQGSTVLEFVVPSLILLMLLAILYPVATRVAERRHSRSQKLEKRHVLPQSSHSSSAPRKLGAVKP